LRDNRRRGAGRGQARDRARARRRAGDGRRPARRRGPRAHGHPLRRARPRLARRCGARVRGPGAQARPAAHPGERRALLARELPRRHHPRDRRGARVTRRIPMVDLEAQTEALWPELEKAALDLLRSGRFILGPNVEAFEREAARFLGVAHAVGVGSGTDALVVGLRALGIGPGDEVIVPSFTFFATAEAVSLIGATPVFADIEPHTFCLEPDSVAKAISLRTRAIIPVHLFGHPAEMDALGDLARRKGLAVLEDAAQGFGAVYRGRKVGGLGNAAAFSFFPSKNLGAFGEAGLITTDDASVADAVRRLRTHGSRERYVHVDIGYNARLDEIQAALLRVKLPHVPSWNDERRRVAKAYDATPAGVAAT